MGLFGVCFSGPLGFNGLRLQGWGWGYWGFIEFSRLLQPFRAATGFTGTWYDIFSEFIGGMDTRPT